MLVLRYSHRIHIKIYDYRHAVSRTIILHGTINILPEGSRKYCNIDIHVQFNNIQQIKPNKISLHLHY